MVLQDVSLLGVGKRRHKHYGTRYVARHEPACSIFTRPRNQIEAWGRNAQNQRKSRRGFLVFSEARLWLQLLTETASLRRPVAS